jgi:hypothetical protein
MEMQSTLVTVWILINVVNPISVKRAGAPNDAMNFISFAQ